MSNNPFVPSLETEFYKTLNKFLQPLKNFSTLQICLFSAACCERYVQFYQVFQERENWGDYSKIRNSLDLCWSCIENFDQIKKDELLRALADMEEAMPDDQIGTNEVILAGTVWGSIIGLLYQCLGETKYPLDNVPIGIFETFKTVIGLGHPDNWGKVFIDYSPELRELEITVLKDLRVRKEMEYQKEDMDDIISRLEVDHDLITLIRERAKTNQWNAYKFIEELENRDGAYREQIRD
jgi:hypothetical protein